MFVLYVGIIVSRSSVFSTGATGAIPSGAQIQLEFNQILKKKITCLQYYEPYP